MRSRPSLAAALAALTSFALPAAAAPDAGTPPEPLFRRLPGGIDPNGFPNLPGLKVSPRDPDGTAAGDAPPRRGAEAPPPKPPTRAESLARLLDRLGKARDPAEARGIAALVERAWMESGSPTADLLMSRAQAALGRDRRDVAAALLDKLIELRPGWAEAWNKRATLRFLEGDDAGSMEDISHVLALEPRHFGALGGMGAILQRNGQDAAALRAMRRALAVYPGDEDLRKAVDKIAPAVEGQDL